MYRQRRHSLLRAAAVLTAVPAVLAAAPLSRGRAADPSPIRFRDLTVLSGGTIDFGTPVSTLEKAACAFFDADGDGWDDLVSLTGRDQPDLLYLNRDDGAGGRTFVPAPAGHGLDSGACLERDGGCVVAGDVDGDGDEDLFVGSTWNATHLAFAPGSGGNVLLLNDGTGRFTDATATAGVDGGDNSTCCAVLFDMDLDGDLDLFTCNTDFETTWKEGDGLPHLWRNEIAETGALHFTEETQERGIVAPGTAVWTASGVDYDADGDFDLLVPHDTGGTTQLFRNDGTGHFADVSAQSGAGVGDDATPSTFGDDSRTAMGIAWGDVENDGDLDLYLTNIARSPLYRSNGDATFTEVGARAGVRDGMVTWGCNFEDFDLDGFVDLYVAGGDIWELAREIVRSYVYRNRRDGTFADVTEGAGLRRDVPLHREMGTACTDFDRDGRVDVLVARAERNGAAPYLYRNETDVEGRRWLTIALRGNGRTSNTSAIGARLRVAPKDAAGRTIPGLTQIREIEGGDSRGSRSGLAQTFGLGADAASADVTVIWPRSGSLAERTQTYRDVPLDRRVVVTEDAREAAWRLPQVAEWAVPDGAHAERACSEDGALDPLTRVAVESGPSWLRVGAWGARGPVLAADVPRCAKEKRFEAALVATAQGASDPESRQALVVRVVPTPRLTEIRRRGAAVLLVGDHLDLRRMEFTVDGTPVTRRRALTHTDRRTGAVEVRATLALPRPMRTSLVLSVHTLEVRDPASGTVLRAEF